MTTLYNYDEENPDLTDRNPMFQGYDTSVGEENDYSRHDNLSTDIGNYSFKDMFDDTNSSKHEDEYHSNMWNKYDDDEYENSYEEENPFMSDRQGKTGGDAKLKTSIGKWIFIGILMIVIFYILIKVILAIKVNGENYRQRRVRKHFDNLHGDTYDDEAKQTIAIGEQIENPRAMDHYRLGVTYLIAARQPDRAAAHFDPALRQIIRGEVETKDAQFILDRINDHIDYFMDYPGVDDLPIQQALLAHYEAKTNLMRNISRKKIEIAEDDPEFTQKFILSRQDWQSDSQNVHDSTLYDSLTKQFNRVRRETVSPALAQRNYDDAVKWLTTSYKDDPVKSDAIKKVLNTVDHNYPITPLNGISEKEYLSTIWKRIHDQGNKDRIDSLREAMADSILDCVEGGNVVCMQGRNTKMWQALAKLDKEEDIGILKSKQAVRNEIYERGAKIVNDFIGQGGTVSDELKDAYNKDEDSTQVNELKDTMRNQIDELRQTYTGQLPADQLDLVVEECKAVI
jgi:hypothetical protein